MESGHRQHRHCQRRRRQLGRLQHRQHQHGYRQPRQLQHRQLQHRQHQHRPGEYRRLQHRCGEHRRLQHRPGQHRQCRHRRLHRRQLQQRLFLAWRLPGSIWLPRRDLYPRIPGPEYGYRYSDQYSDKLGCGEYSRQPVRHSTDYRQRPGLVLSQHHLRHHIHSGPQR
ncbi:hypothetical protein MKSMC1_35240 [Mycobacterium kansasii]|nr:hypothetical protein MKSMC1_35240 [Mycobacterium kansasii]